MFEIVAWGFKGEKTNSHGDGIANVWETNICWLCKDQNWGNYHHMWKSAWLKAKFAVIVTHLSVQCPVPLNLRWSYLSEGIAFNSFFPSSIILLVQRRHDNLNSKKQITQQMPDPSWVLNLFELQKCVSKNYIRSCISRYVNIETNEQKKLSLLMIILPWKNWWMVYFRVLRNVEDLEMWTGSQFSAI